ncbi:MAG: hypothetical protein ACOC44_09580 [Promethearchaeia archaeon]
MIQSSPVEKISQMQRLNTLTWGIAFVLLGFVNICNILWQYVLILPMYKLLFDQLAALFFHLAIFIKIVNTELIINKHDYFYRGYYFSIIILGLLFFTLIVTPPVIRSNLLLNIIYLLWGNIGVSIYVYTFIFLYVRSKKKTEQKKALKILVCPVLFVVGMVFQPQNLILYIAEVPLFTILISLIIIIPQLLISLGVILMYTTYNDNFQKPYRNLFSN